jgi:hypothetical protein
MPADYLDDNMGPNQTRNITSMLGRLRRETAFDRTEAGFWDRIRGKTDTPVELPAISHSEATVQETEVSGLREELQKLTQEVEKLKSKVSASEPTRMLDHLSDIAMNDKQELDTVIQLFNAWCKRHDYDSPTLGMQELWSHSIYHIKNHVSHNLLLHLTTFEEKQAVHGEGVSNVVDVKSLFVDIDTVRKALMDKTVDPMLLQMEPELLLDIINKLEIFTRHVIHNTSLQKLCSVCF